MPFKGVTIVDALSARVDVKDEKTGQRVAWVELAGPEHPKRKAIQFAKQRRMRKVLERTGKIEFSDPSDDEAESLDLLVASTLSWSDEWVDASGAPLACTAENVRKEYSIEGYGWLRAQLLKAMDERERFITSSATT